MRRFARELAGWAFVAVAVAAVAMVVLGLCVEVAKMAPSWYLTAPLWWLR